MSIYSDAKLTVISLWFSTLKEIILMLTVVGYVISKMPSRWRKLLCEFNKIRPNVLKLHFMCKHMTSTGSRVS